MDNKELKTCTIAITWKVFRVMDAVQSYSHWMLADFLAKNTGNSYLSSFNSDLFDYFSGLVCDGLHSNNSCLWAITCKKLNEVKPVKDEDFVLSELPEESKLTWRE